MPPFPNSFPPKKEILANFDFTDIASGTGSEQFANFNTKDSTGTSYKITDLITIPFSDEIETTSPPLTADGTFLKTADFDFDGSVFNLPRTMRGNSVIKYSFIVSMIGTNNQTVFAGTYNVPNAFPTLNKDRILVLTNLGAFDEIPNIYSISLK